MNKSLLEVYNFPDKIRLGCIHDGGYVICKLDGHYDCYISCGIAGEASFDRDFLNLHKNIGKNNSFAFDGTIRNYPWHFTKDITFIKKNISNFNDDNHTDLNELINKYENIFLSIDIEGGEYPWILSLTKDKLQKFKQICIEIHGINDNTWGSLLSDKMKCLEKINETHYLMHAHGNNWPYNWPRNIPPINQGNRLAGMGINNIPEILELTYIRKNSISSIPSKNKTPLPIDGLDYSNHPKGIDYTLNYYPFVDKK